MAYTKTYIDDSAAISSWGKRSDGEWVVCFPYWCGHPSLSSGCHNCPMHEECDVAGDDK